MNVGLGNFIALTIGNKAMLFDAGTMDGRDPVTGRDLTRHPSEFTAAGVSILRGKDICAVAITHPHRDHWSLIMSVLTHSGVRAQHVRFICGGLRRHLDVRSDEASERADALRMHISDNAIFSLEEKEFGEEVAYPLERDVDAKKAEIENFLQTQFGIPELRFEVFLPRVMPIAPFKRTGIHITSNIVFKITFLEKSILITGDAMPQTVASFREGERPFGDVDVYVVPHHGSKENNLEGFLGQTTAKVVVCSVDGRFAWARKNGLPRIEIVRMFESRLPKTAPRHRVLCWEGAQKAVAAGDPPPPPPMEVDIEIPFWTTGGTFFRYRDSTVQGIHLRFDKDGDQANGFIEIFENEEIKTLPLSGFWAEARGDPEPEESGSNSVD
jgi:beta-lactamase superfamily II metal-dependent hydrolase